MKLILEDKDKMEVLDIPQDTEDAQIIKAAIALLRRIRSNE